jgi:hypothetical protein
MPPLPVPAAGHLARLVPRLLAGVGRSNIGGFEAWHQTSVRLLNSSVSQTTNLQPQTAETSPETLKENPVEVATGPSLADISRDMSYRPDNLDKRILVHYKYYPNIQSVPEYVSQGRMNQAKSWARIKTANVMIATTVGLCLLTIIWAKSLMRENSLLEENYRRHMKFKSKEGDGSQSSRMGLLTNSKKDLNLEEEKI